VVSDGGGIDYNDLAALKVTGSVPLIGPLDLGRDWLRIYAIITYRDKSDKTALGTFLASTPTLTLTSKRGVTGALVRGSADLYSLLLVLEQTAFDTPYSVPAGTNAVARAKALVASVGLRVVADDSASVLSTPPVWEAGTSYLEAVNWLLKYAGFDTAEVDGYGAVIMRRYSDPAMLSPVVTFADDADCIFADEVPYEFDIFSVPNKVIAVMSSQDATMTTTAINADPLNRYSTVARGRTVTHVETVSQIESQEALNALAQRVLQEKTSAVESVIVRHVWIPVLPGQGARLAYARADTDFTGVISSMTVKLSKSMPCDTRVRKFVRF
jgi:hypothetical protein